MVWVGPDLSPWLQGPIETLATNALHVALMDSLAGMTRASRDVALFGEAHADHAGEAHAAHDGHDASEHEDDDHDNAGEGHGDGHAEHGHAEDARGALAEDDAHDDGDHADLAADAHAHGTSDPHLWLDPRIGRAIVALAAERLSALDPANAAVYATNAAAATEALSALEADLADTLAPVRDVPFVVAHDSFQYFEARFGLAARGAVADSDADAPGAARLAVLRDALADGRAVCLFAEPVGEDAAARMLARDAGIGLGLLDPLGVDIAPGPGHYPALLRRLAEGITACLAG